MQEASFQIRPQLWRGPIQGMEDSLRFDYRQFNRESLLRILSHFGVPQKLRILYVSTYNPRYTRTEALLGLLAQTGLTVKTILTGDSRLKYAKAVRGLLKHGAECDVVFVGFRGHEILPVLRMLTRKPIVFDAFVSVYDTLCLDRGVFRPDSFIARCLKAYDRALCRLSETVLVDTWAHKQYFESEFGTHNVDYLYVGCNEALFRPLPVATDNDMYTVFWYGVANPLQGVDVILKAAKLLEGKPIRFRLVGPVKHKYSRLLNRLSLRNVDLVDFVPYEQLPMAINRADVCLGGHFSNKDKANRVIAGKTFQFLACGKPTIVGDNAANQELFTEGGLVHFIEMNNAEVLASKITWLRRHIKIQRDLNPSIDTVQAGI